MDAAEALGANPNEGNITIKDIRKEAETKLSSVEDKNVFWKDRLQDRSGFAKQLGDLGIVLNWGLAGFKRDFDVGSKLMIAAATAGYNENNMIGRVAGVYGIIGNIELVDLWEKRAESYRAAEKSKAEERLAREHPQDMERSELEQFATKGLRMDPKEFCKALETISDNDVLSLMQIYDQRLSQSNSGLENYKIILRMALTSRETERIGEITSQAERELSNNLENMFKAFEESDLGTKATVLNVMQMTQEDMSTEHRAELKKGRLTGRVETSSFMSLKMIDAESRGETLNTVIDRIESAVTAKRKANTRAEANKEKEEGQTVSFIKKLFTEYKKPEAKQENDTQTPDAQGRKPKTTRH